MNFFCTENDFDIWTKNMNLGDIEIFKLHIIDAIEVSKEIFEFR